MARGGKRPGAGRPKGSKEAHTLEKEAAREAVRTLVMRHMEPMVLAQVSQAMGIRYLVVRNKASGQFVRVAKGAAEKLKPAEETIEVWEKDPSTSAFTDLMNRALDKPKEQPQDMNLHHEGDWAKIAARMAKVGRAKNAQRQE